MTTETVIDLRSDVVTQPTAEMRRVMQSAAVGAYSVDNKDEDPTVHKLEDLAARQFNKEAALFVPTVTMANLIACMYYCRPGEQVIVDEDAHVYRHEFSGITRLAGLLPRPVERIGAVPDIEAVGRLLSHRYLETKTSLLWIENTHTDGGGAIAEASLLTSLRKITLSQNIPIHVDGARIFNAAVALSIPVAKLLEDVDSVSVSFTKGLGCPLGAILVGSRKLIEAALVLRRMLGGTWLKAGVIAAPCILALNTMVDRLVEDHRAAARLAEAVQETAGLRLACPVTTNQLRIDTSQGAPAVVLCDAFRERGVLVGIVGPNLIRMVTHYGVSTNAIDRVIRAIDAVADMLSLR